MLKNLTASLRIFFSGAWLAYVGLFHWAKPTNYIASKILLPLGSILFFTLLGMSARGQPSADFYLLGNAMHVATLSGVYGSCLSVSTERNLGTLVYILGTPANRLVTFMGRAFFHIIDGTLSVILAFAWGVLLLNLDLSTTNWPGLALAILITTASVSGLGLLLGSVGLVTVNVLFLIQLVYWALLLLSGANVPIEQLPSWMQALSAALPLTRGIAAARLLVQGSGLVEVAPLLAGELAIGTLYASVGFTFFNWFEFQAKRRGSLEAV